MRLAHFLNDGMPPVYTVGPLINLQGQTHLGTNQTEHDECWVLFFLSP